MEFPWDQMPSNPVRQFQLLYCLWLSLAMLRNGRQHYRFYRWFYSSDLGPATKRGLGAHPSRIYGIFTPPILSPAQLAAAGVAFTACLLFAVRVVAAAPASSSSSRTCCTSCTSRRCSPSKATLSGHGSILIPSMLFLLACSPSLDHEVQSRSEWPLTLIRIYLASGYFSSGMCKLSRARFGKFWGMGPTLQYYIFDALWSRPAGPTVRRIQETAITAPRIMTFLATSSMFFEIGFISAPFSDMMSVFFGLNGLAFHAGIMLFQVLPLPHAVAPTAATNRHHRPPLTAHLPPRAQGLDFCTWWSPALLAFVVGVPSAEPWRAILNGWQLEPYFLPAAIYTSLQVLTTATLRDFWLDDVLPLSCRPMFMLPRNLFDAWPKWWTMTDAPLNGSTRASGAMEPLYWSPALARLRDARDGRAEAAAEGALVWRHHRLPARGAQVHQARVPPPPLPPLLQLRAAALPPRPPRGARRRHPRRQARRRVGRQKDASAPRPPAAHASTNSTSAPPLAATPIERPRDRRVARQVILHITKCPYYAHSSAFSSSCDLSRPRPPCSLRGCSASISTSPCV